MQILHKDIVPHLRKLVSEYVFAAYFCQGI